VEQNSKGGTTLTSGRGGVSKRLVAKTKRDVGVGRAKGQGGWKKKTRERPGEGGVVLELCALGGSEVTHQ